jgi:hypothetical protein
MLQILTTASTESDTQLSVELSSPSGLFSIRQAGSELILKPAGLALFEYSTEHWKYETSVTDPTQLYEYWLKYGMGSQAFYVPSFTCPLASIDPIGSESDEDAPIRHLQIKREQTPSESFGEFRGDSVRLRVTVTGYSDIDPHVFGNRDGDAGADFSFIASSFDPEIYPKDGPGDGQDPPFYLKSQIDVLVPSPAAADTIWNNILTELDVRIAAQNRRDSLSESSSQRIE